jgi:AsmA-like C-terminal region
MTAEDPSSPTPTPTPPALGGFLTDDLLARLRRRRQRLWRRFKRTVRWLVAIPIVLGVAAYLVMRSPMVGRIAADKVRTLSGGELRYAIATIELDGRLIIRDAELRAPTAPGDAGRVIAAKAIIIDLDWTGLLSGNVSPVGLALDAPEFLVSLAISDGVPNIATLTPAAGTPSGAGGPSSTLPIRVAFTNATFVLGEHDPAGRVTPLRTIRADGHMLPTRADRPVFTVGMQERIDSASGPAPRAMVLDGRIDLLAGASSLRVNNIMLDRWGPDAVPATYRDAWQRLNLRDGSGVLELASSRDTGPSATIRVRDVSMSALVPTQDEQAGPVPDGARFGDRDLGLRNVDGTVRIAASGIAIDASAQIDGQPGQSWVKLQTRGLSADAALDCEIRAQRFSITSDPTFLSYIPKTARQYFDIFSSPTGTIEASALISRAEPTGGVPAPVVVSGTVQLENGTAAFHKFPYPVHGISARARFTDNELIFDYVRGRGPTGARVQATAEIGPLTEEARVDVTVNVTEAPIDAHLISAMPESRRIAVENIFDHPSFERLLAEGLIRRPGELDVFGGRRGAPFALAGDADLRVRVRRALGSENLWTTDISADLREVGVLPKAFALPIVGRNVRLRITDETAQLESGIFEGLGGGRFDLNVFVSFFDRGLKVLKPDITIAGIDIPVNALLINAVSNAGNAPSSAQSAQSTDAALETREALERVDLTGSIDCDARILLVDPPVDAALVGPPVPDPGSLSYDVGVRLDGLKAVPRPSNAAPSLALQDFLGELRVTPERLAVRSLQARIVRLTDAAGPPLEPTVVGPSLPAGDSDAGHLSLDIDAALAGKDAGRLAAKVRVLGLNLQEPLEQFVAVLAPDAASWLSERRVGLDPGGTVFATVDAARPAGRQGTRPDMAVQLDVARDLELGLMGGRLGLDLVDGQLALSVPALGTSAIRARDAVAALRWNDQPAGDLGISGLVAIDPETARVGPSSQAELSMTNWRFESPLVVPVVRSFGGVGAGEALQEFAPEGLFDAEAVLRASTSAAPGAHGPRPDLRAELRPRKLSFQRRGERVAFSDLTGTLTLDAPADGPVVGSVVGFRGVSPSFTLALDGGFTQRGPTSDASASTPSPIDLALSVDLESQRPDAALIAWLPEAARSLLDKLKVRFEGPVRLTGGRLAGPLADTHGTRLGFSGQIDFTDVSLDIGLPVTHVVGVLDILTAPSDADRANTSVQATLAAPRLRIAGLPIEGLSVRAETTDRPGSVEINQLAASCLGGRIAGQGRIDSSTPADPSTAGFSESPVLYAMDLSVAGVAFAPLLTQLSLAGAAEPLVGPVQDELSNPDITRGRLDARVSLSGIAGDVESRLGRGAVRIAHGEIIRLPIIFPLMQISNFILPSDDRLSRLTADFTLRGPQARVENIVAAGDTLSLYGSGTLNWPDMTLDMRFNSKSNARLPLISDLLEAVRDELVTTTITGTLTDPVLATETLSSARRAMQAMFSAAPRPPGAGRDRRPLTGATDLVDPNPGPDPAQSLGTQLRDLADRTRLIRADGEPVPTVWPR